MNGLKKLSIEYLLETGFPIEFKSELESGNIQYYLSNNLFNIKQNLYNITKFNKINDYSTIYFRVNGEFEFNFEEELKLVINEKPSSIILVETENVEKEFKLKSLENHLDTINFKFESQIDELQGLNYSMIHKKLFGQGKLILKNIEFFLDSDELKKGKVENIFLSAPEEISFNDGKSYIDYLYLQDRATKVKYKINEIAANNNN